LAISVENITFLRWLFEQEAVEQDNVSLYREYYDGDHNVKLSERQEEYIQGVDGRFCLNMCPVVVNSMTDRLVVSGFSVSAPPSTQGDEAARPEGEEPETAWAETINEWWTDNRGDGLQRKIHKAAARDGNSYAIVSWDEEKGRPRFEWQPRFVAYGGNPNNGRGVKVHYEPDGVTILCASKRWVEVDRVTLNQVRRLNLYFADRIEKYYADTRSGDAGYEGNWQEWMDEGDAAWPLPWRDAKGQPLGVPIAHFKNADAGYAEGDSELVSVIPLQDVLNKILVDMTADADYSAFRILTQSGGKRPDGNAFPGMIMHNPDKEVKFGVIDGSGSDQFITAIDAVVKYIADVTRTPQYMFFQTGQMPSGEALKTAESGLMAKVQDRQVGYGNAYEDMMTIAVRLANTFGGGVDIPDGAIINTVWDETATVTLEDRRDKADFLLGAGFERESLRVYGYDDVEIERLETERQESRESETTLAELIASAARASFETGARTPPPGTPAVANRVGQQ